MLSLVAQFSPVAIITRTDFARSVAESIQRSIGIGPLYKWPSKLILQSRVAGEVISVK